MTQWWISSIMSICFMVLYRNSAHLPKWACSPTWTSEWTWADTSSAQSWMLDQSELLQSWSLRYRSWESRYEFHWDDGDGQWVSLQSFLDSFYTFNLSLAIWQIKLAQDRSWYVLDAERPNSPHQHMSKLLWHGRKRSWTTRSISLRR